MLAGAVGTAVLYEDEEVRVWENKIPAFTKGEEHSHDQDYWLLMGTASRSPLVYVKQGCGGHGTEVAGNPSEFNSCAYLVELKATAAQPEVAAAAKATARHADPTMPATQVLFENTELVLWDQRAATGQTAPPPPLGAASPNVWQFDVHGLREGAVPLTELAAIDEHAYQANFANPRSFGETYHAEPAAAASDSSARPGAAVDERCAARNVGSTPLRCILLEMKAAAEADKAQQDAEEGRPRL